MVACLTSRRDCCAERTCKLFEWQVLPAGTETANGTHCWDSPEIKQLHALRSKRWVFDKLHALPHTHNSLSMCAVQGQDNAKDLAGLETTDESEDEVSHVDSRRREILQASEQASVAH